MIELLSTPFDGCAYITSSSPISHLSAKVRDMFL